MVFEIDNPTTYRAGLYIRLSKEDDGEGPSESVSNQKSLLLAFVKEHGLTVYGTYIDDGWSGTSFDRPDFRRLLSDIETKKVNMVITKDLSRLGRDYILTGHYMERYFPEKQVRYISLLDGVDTGVDSTSNDITPFRAIMNDMYAKDISKKIRSVKHDKQRKGLFIGGKPAYGYRMAPDERNKIIIDEKAAAHVRRIFDMALSGMSCRQIAVRLNTEEVPTPARYAGLNPGRSGPYAGLWSSERISEMLRNETYIGSMVQGRSRKISYKSKKSRKLARENWVVVEGTHEPLIDEDAFRRVQMLLDSRRTTRSRTYDFLLKGLIFCHECGCSLGVINRKKANGEDCLYFICRTYQRFTKAGVCTCHSVKVQTMTDAVLKTVGDICSPLLQNEALLPVAMAAVAEAHRAGSPDGESAALRSKISKLTSDFDELYMDKLHGTLDEEDYRRISQRLRTERAALEQKLSVLEASDMPSESPVNKAAALTKRFTGSFFSSREALTSLIERVELTEDKKLILRFRFSRPDLNG